MTLSSPHLAGGRPSALIMSDWPAPWCAFCTLTHSPRCRSPQRMIPSLPPLISSAPLGLQASAYTFSLGSLKVYRRSPLYASQILSSPPPIPPPPLASLRPSGLQATLMTMPRCPCREALTIPSEASQRKTLPSSPQLARRVPSGLQATRRILVSCARPTHRRGPVVTSHTRIASSHPPLARTLPSGLHATPSTIHLWPCSNLGGILPPASQTVTSRSEPALASQVPSGLHATS